jgi:protein NrfD
VIPPSSTWFTASPRWGWLIVLYFFLGGLAGGSYFLAALIELFGRREDRPLARLGYYVAFPLVAISGLLLTVDLSRPLRFWHMLIERNTLGPMFKSWSPMSVGSWALTLFGLFTFLSFLGAVADADRRRWSMLTPLGAGSALSRVIAVCGGFLGFFVAGYTGVLLAVTNRPIWSDTPLLGMLFVVSAASSSAALMILLARRYGWTTPGLPGLHRMDLWMIVLELVVLVATIVSLGSVARAWLNAWGLLLLVGVIVPGLLIPLMVAWRPLRFRQWSAAMPILVLIGAFLLRVVIVFSSEAI